MQTSEPRLLGGSVGGSGALGVGLGVAGAVALEGRRQLRRLRVGSGGVVATPDRERS